ncbi:hypothetical protein [Prosthecobacter algae]
MWASDCPFQVDPGHTYKDSIALIRDRLLAPLTLQADYFTKLPLRHLLK